MPKVRVGDINIYYEVHGDGEPLVMINGAGGSVDWVRRIIPTYSREYRLVLFDNRGAGQSDKPDKGYTTATMADDLAGLLDEIGIDSAHVRGVSFGGMIAQEFALRHPKRMRSLILNVTSCGGPRSVKPLSAEMEGIRQLPPREATEALLRWFITGEFIERNPKFFQQLVAFALEHPIDPDCLAKHTDAIKEHDTYDRLPEIMVPTLVLAGDADRVIPVENAQILASRIPNAELVILKSAGHMLIEAAQEADRITLDFLRRHRKEV
jgi:pimeloyl-ACP methyl ester carboxylesterase